MDKAKYLSDPETKQLRERTEARAIIDRKKGRRQWIVAWAYVDIALKTGLRISEIANLTVGDFNRRRGTLTVRRLKRRKAVVDTLPLARTLALHVAEFLDWKAAAGENVAEDAPLFMGKRGPLTHWGLRSIWTNACEAANLPGRFPPKSARHTLGMKLMDETGNLRLVQQQLGHARPETTTVYASVHPEKQAAAVEAAFEEDAA